MWQKISFFGPDPVEETTLQKSKQNRRKV